MDSETRNDAKLILILLDRFRGKLSPDTMCSCLYTLGEIGANMAVISDITKKPPITGGRHNDEAHL